MGQPDCDTRRDPRIVAPWYLVLIWRSSWPFAVKPSSAWLWSFSEDQLLLWVTLSDLLYGPCSVRDRGIRRRCDCRLLGRRPVMYVVVQPNPSELQALGAREGACEGACDGDAEGLAPGDADGEALGACEATCHRRLRALLRRPYRAHAPQRLRRRLRRQLTLAPAGTTAEASYNSTPEDHAVLHPGASVFMNTGCRTAPGGNGEAGGGGEGETRGGGDGGGRGGGGDGGGRGGGGDGAGAAAGAGWPTNTSSMSCTPPFPVDESTPFAPR
jgi:hypothetical protein